MGGGLASRICDGGAGSEEKYVGRTPHIRVKISAGQSELTTQLHLPNQRSNYSDNFFDKKPQIQNTSEGFIFDFIVG